MLFNTRRIWKSAYRPFYDGAMTDTRGRYFKGLQAAMFSRRACDATPI
jgi:hypothetical protein